jgi:purine-nucleoside phosphorylase
MLIVDHINFTGQNPLIGPNLETWGPRFPDMTEPYSRRLIGIAKSVARENGIPLREGVYIGVTGPSMETAAETRMFRMLGADAVGMSTVMEVITAVHLGMEVLGISVITNVNRPDCYEPVPLETVIARASGAAPTLLKLVSLVLKKL